MYNDRVRDRIKILFKNLSKIKSCDTTRNAFELFECTTIMKAYFYALEDLGYTVYVKPENGKAKHVRILKGENEIDKFDL